MWWQALREPGATLELYPGSASALAPDPDLERSLGVCHTFWKIDGYPVRFDSTGSRRRNGLKRGGVGTAPNRSLVHRAVHSICIHGLRGFIVRVVARLVAAPVARSARRTAARLRFARASKPTVLPLAVSNPTCATAASRASSSSSTTHLGMTHTDSSNASRTRSSCAIQLMRASEEDAIRPRALPEEDICFCSTTTPYRPPAAFALVETATRAVGCKIVTLDGRLQEARLSHMGRRNDSRLGNPQRQSFRISAR